MGTRSKEQNTREVATVLRVDLNHAAKHTQRMLELTHAAVKTLLTPASDEFRNNWQKLLPLVVLDHNTTYHESFGCERTRIHIIYQTTV